MALRSRLFHAKLPSLAKEGWLRHPKNGPLPLKARPGWFIQQPIIGGLNQPPRLRPLRRLRGILLMGAATPPLPRGVWLAPKSSEKQKVTILSHKDTRTPRNAAFLCILVSLCSLTAAGQSVPSTRALLDRYCVTCHNEKLATAGLMLDKMDLDKVRENPAVWEKVV